SPSHCARSAVGAAFQRRPSSSGSSSAGRSLAGSPSASRRRPTASAQSTSCAAYQRRSGLRLAPSAAGRAETTEGAAAGCRAGGLLLEPSRPGKAVIAVGIGKLPAANRRRIYVPNGYLFGNPILCRIGTFLFL